VDMIPTHSYSSLKMLKTCPHDYWRTYVKKDLPFRETVEMKWGTRVHSALELRLRDKTKLPADLLAHEGFALALDRFDPSVELKLGCRRDGTQCDFFAKDVWLRGKVDVFIEGQDVGALYDWKTGKTFEDPFELRVQALLIKISRPHLHTIKGQYIWLKAGKLGREHNCSDTAMTWHELVELDHKAHKFDELGAWPKVSNVLCGWCSVHDCEHNPEGRHADTRGQSQTASQPIP
jgi:hypothetical protein